MKLRGKWKLIAVIGVLIIAAVLAAGSFKESKNTSGEQPEGVTYVRVDTVSKGDLTNTVKVSATVKAAKKVAVVPKLSGKVTDVKVEVGQKVKKGDLLVTLDDQDIRAQIRVNEAALKSTEVGLQTAKIAYDEAKKNLSRMEELYAEGAISEKQLEDAKNGFERAKASYEPGSGNTQTAAQIDQARAQLDAAMVNLSNTKITSPIDGTVTAVNIEVGETAGPQSPVINLINTDKMLVEGSLSESEVNIVKPGDEVEVVIPSAGDKPFKGVVESISPAADTMTKAYPTEVRVTEESSLIKDGMTAEIHLTSEVEKDVITIQKEAVIEQDGENIVFVVDGDKAKKRVVTLGLITDKKVQIKDGLEVGENLVTKGQNFLHDGAKVRIQSGGE